MWNQTYGGPASEGCIFAVETTDGGYAMLGHTYSFGSGDADIWLVKTNLNGNMEWNKTYGTPDYDFANHLLATDDGGYIIVSAITPVGFDYRDVWLIKTDSIGNIQWNRTYGGNGDDKAWKITKTSDNGYAVVGRTNSYGQGQNDIWLFKIDSIGSIQWNTTFGGLEEESGRGIIETSDNGFLLTGWSGSYGAGQLDYWLVKTDVVGNHEWNQTFGGAETERAGKTIIANDGNYVTVGNTGSFGEGETDFYLVKTDNFGNLIWNITYGGALAETPFDIIKTSDGGYAITGHSYSFGGGENDIWLVKTDSDGNMIFNQTYGGEMSDSSRSIIQKSDGGYVIAGSTHSFSQGEDDFWLIKTNENGIISEFSSWSILPFLLLTALMVVIFFKKKANI
jgi:hypothetical protein